MDKSDIDNYAYFQEVWTSPKRYALVKNEFRDGYAIVDVINKLFVIIEDEDIKRLSMIMTLYETDFSKEDIDEYMQLILSGENDEECLKILSQKRKKALDKIHILEKQISNLDYLKNEIKNNN